VKAIVEQGPKQASQKVNAKQIPPAKAISAQKQASQKQEDPKANAKQALQILLVKVIAEQGRRQASQKQEDPKANAKQAPLTLPVKGIAGGQVLALKPESVCLMI
jgi:hypothetical protein